MCDALDPREQDIEVEIWDSCKECAGGIKFHQTIRALLSQYLGNGQPRSLTEAGQMRA